eukprot:SAG31_NODE_4263_length_3399_cov_2.469394_2_plen_272_part_00
MAADWPVAPFGDCVAPDLDALPVLSSTQMAQPDAMKILLHPNLQVDLADLARGWGMPWLPSSAAHPVSDSAILQWFPGPRPPAARTGGALQGWADYLAWRHIRPDSPAPLLLTFGLTLYHTLEKTGLISSLCKHRSQVHKANKKAAAPGGEALSPLVVHLPGSEKEQDIMPALAEAGWLLLSAIGYTDAASGSSNATETMRQPPVLLELHLIGPSLSRSLCSSGPFSFGPTLGVHTEELFCMPTSSVNKQLSFFMTLVRCSARAPRVVFRW